MLDVLVTCHPHRKEIALFPQVRGHYLAEQLRRTGLRAEFRQLPVRRARCRVLICSEYQQTMVWFDRHLAAPLARIRADRMFCMTEVSLHDNDEHDFSREYCEWFAARGGVLCHVAPRGLEPYEQCIGVGVDSRVVRPDPNAPRDTVLFDFRATTRTGVSETFDVKMVEQVRERCPQLRVVGSGIADPDVQAAFDDWVPYGQPHQEYVRLAFGRAVAMVVGWEESLGLAVAEAQVAGACIISSPGQVLSEMLVPEAAIGYEPGDADALVQAVAAAASRDPEQIRAQAAERFDLTTMARRVRAAIGL